MFARRALVLLEYDPGRVRDEAGLGGGGDLLRRRQRNLPVFTNGDGTDRGEIDLAVVLRLAEAVVV